MQKLLLAEAVFDALETGKCTTIRKGIREVTLGQLLFESTDVQRQVVVNIHSIYSCPLRNVKHQDLINDGFKDYNDMKNQMSNFYPDITFDSLVTVINFNLLT